jgi:pyruvate/2-oxoglutarate/acetoin dehydrogenase E1 component
MYGLRPIIEFMSWSFCLVAADQIINNAPKMLYMSGGQFSVPVVIRMATGAGRQLAAQHAHSLEGWFAHIPGLRIVTPATLEDARGMLWTAIEDPDPVLIFEHQMLYNMEGDLPDDAGPVDIDRARVRRNGKDVTLITYGGSLGKVMTAATELQREGIEAEVIDLRTLRPMDTDTIIASVKKTGRAVTVASPSVQDVMDAIHVRLLLEPEVVRLAAKHITPTQLETLQRAQAGLDRAILDQDRAAWSRADNVYHETISAACPNQLLGDLAMQYRNRVSYLSIDAQGDFERLSACTHEHRQIVQAIAAHDYEAAAQTMRDHIEMFRESIFQRLSHY